MKLIIDSGSTKTHWVLLDGKQIVENFTTTGFNPYYSSTEEIRKSIAAELPGEMKTKTVDNIYFYGTGCSTANNCSKIKTILQQFFKNAQVETHHDLFGAAVALQKNRKGIAAILGTGSNSCLWDGRQIVENVPSTGWIIGDEGSATYLGKIMLKAFLSGEMPENITRAFYDFTSLDFEGILHKIYSEPQPNRWISGLSPFASSHMENRHVRELIKKNFRDFLETQVKKYTGYKECEISFTGSVAWYFREILHEVLKEEGLHLGIILQQPMDGLIEFHSHFS
jgi:glucosamine kinase